jgi:copper chaperone CopZ
MKDTVKYEVSGMTCGGCQRSVQGALKRAGIEVSLDDISLSDGTVSIAAEVLEATVRSTIGDAGYDVGRRLESEV